MDKLHSALLVLVVAAVTLLLRALPFFVFGKDRRTPDVIVYLGRVLPYAVMAMLVVYCYKTVDVTASPFGLPEFIAGAAVVILHLLKGNTLVSIVGGTVVYMLLGHFVF